MRVLVVDDDAAVARFMRRVLEEDGFAVDVAGECEGARSLAIANDYNALVLDLGLPDGNGLTLIGDLRRQGRTTPILVVTGTSGEEMLVRALNAGADDFVGKPVSIDHFRARMRALVRRGGAQRTEQLTVSNLVLNRLTRTLLVAGKPVELTPKELSLIEELLLHQGEVVTRTSLLEKVHGLSFDPGTNVLEVNVSRLRRKLTDAGATVSIVSRRSIGITLTESASATSEKSPPAVQ